MLGGGPLAQHCVEHVQGAAVDALRDGQAAGHHQRVAASPDSAARLTKATEEDLVLPVDGLPTTEQRTVFARRNPLEHEPDAFGEVQQSLCC